MSREELKRYIPDSPEEWSFIGSSVNRLGAVITGIGAFQENFKWVIISAGLTWLGHELSEYFKIHTKKNEVPKP
jgi:hypothetical protein